MPRKPRGGTVGRPRLTAEGETVRKNVVLTAEQAAWLEKQAGGASAAMRRLVERAMAEEAQS